MKAESLKAMQNLILNVEYNANDKQLAEYLKDEFTRIIRIELPQSSNPKFVEECKEEWYADWDDDKFVRNLACWLDGYSDKCPLFPVDVYFPGNEMMTEWKDFEDDEDEDEEEKYQSQLELNKTQISLMQSFLKLYRNQLCGMILSELRRGHNLVGRFDPYPGWDSHHLYGYEIDNKTMVVEEMADGCMVLALYQEGYDTERLPLSASDFPIEVLFNIYAAMK